MKIGLLFGDHGKADGKEPLKHATPLVVTIQPRPVKDW